MTTLGTIYKRPINAMSSVLRSFSSPRRFVSIRTRLALGFTLILLVTLATAVVGYVTLQNFQGVVQSTLQEAIPIRELSLEIENEFLAARESEASFLSSWRSIGFGNALSNYVTVNQSHMARARSGLNELQTLVQNSGDPMLHQLITQTAHLKPLLDNYESIFSSTVSKIDQRSRDNQLERSLQSQLTDLESGISALPDDDPLHTLIAAIRANERDYFNSGQQQFADNVQIAVNQFIDTVPSATNPSGAPLLADVIRQVRAYWQTFDTIATLDQDVETNTAIFRDLTSDITDLTSAIRNSSQAGLARAREQLQAINDRSTLILVLSGVIALSAANVVIFLLARRIMTPLGELTAAAQRMAEGKLEQGVTAKGNDEFTVLAEAFNAMAEQLQDLVGSLEQRVGARTAELDAVLQVSLSLTSNLSLQDVLNLIVKSAYQLLHDPRDVQIFLYEGNRLHFGAAISEGILRDRPVREPRPNGLTYAVARSGRAAVVPNMKTDPHYANAEMEGAVVSFPLKIGERVVGAINFTYVQPREISQAELRVLRLLTDQTAIAIENARLFQTERTAREHAERLQAATQALSSTINLQRVFDLILQELRNVVPYDTAAVLQLKGVELEIIGGYGFPDLNEARGYKLNVARGDNPNRAVILSRTPLVLNHAQESYSDFRSGPYAKVHIQSWIGVPLLFGDKVIGMITLAKAEPNFYLLEHAELAMAFAAQAAIAIENARLYASAQQELAERKEAEKQLALARDQALSANRAKSQFLANMSHELRTPLNAIIGYSEMLQEECADSEQDGLIPDLQKIHAAGRHLLQLINDILDLSKIEAGKMELYSESFDVALLVDEITSTIYPLFERKGNRLVVNCDLGIGPMQSDITKLRQALFNLLSNASKFTEHGTVTLDVQREKSLQGPEHDWLMFTVTDNGIGMTLEQLDRLFQAFTQADASTTRKFGGTGLGLAITKRYCQMMGGDISATSEPGHGSQFVIRLPATAPIPGAAPEAVPETAPKPVAQPSEMHTVLIIDDDPAARDMLSDFLGKEGFQILTAADGASGLQAAQEHHPDAIILDVILSPTIADTSSSAYPDGWSVLVALKSKPETTDIPVIMVTIVDDRKLGYALGAADYLTKPFEREDLLSAVKKHLDTATPHSILIVEDDAATREIAHRTLEKEGWTVVEAVNGREGLERVAASMPALILLDLMMPEMDGFQFAAELRRNPQWQLIPVMVMTAKELTPEERRRLNGNVERVLKKGTISLTRDGLLAEVRSLVRGHIQRKK